MHHRLLNNMNRHLMYDPTSKRPNGLCTLMIAPLCCHLLLLLLLTLLLLQPFTFDSKQSASASCAPQHRQE